MRTAAPKGGAPALNGFSETGAGAALVIDVSCIIQVQPVAWYMKFTCKIYPQKILQQHDIETLTQKRKGPKWEFNVGIYENK